MDWNGFSLWLNPNTRSATAPAGELIFGGADARRYSGQIQYHPNQSARYRCTADVLSSLLRSEMSQLESEGKRVKTVLTKMESRKPVLEIVQVLGPDLERCQRGREDCWQTCLKASPSGQWNLPDLHQQ